MLIQTKLGDIVRAKEGSQFWYQNDIKSGASSMQANIHAAAGRIGGNISVKHYMCIDSDRNIIDLFLITVIKQGKERKPRGRNKDESVKTIARNAEMVKMHKEGYKYEAIGRLHNLSRQRVRQIVSKHMRKELMGS